MFAARFDSAPPANLRRTRGRRLFPRGRSSRTVVSNVHPPRTPGEEKGLLRSTHLSSLRPSAGASAACRRSPLICKNVQSGVRYSGYVHYRFDLRLSSRFLLVSRLAAVRKSSPNSTVPPGKPTCPGSSDPGPFAEQDFARSSRADSDGRGRGRTIQTGLPRFRATGLRSSSVPDLS